MGAAESGFAFAGTQLPMRTMAEAGVNAGPLHTWTVGEVPDPLRFDPDKVQTWRKESRLAPVPDEAREYPASYVINEPPGSVCQHGICVPQGTTSLDGYVTKDTLIAPIRVDDDTRHMHDVHQFKKVHHDKVHELKRMLDAETDITVADGQVVHPSKKLFTLFVPTTDMFNPSELFTTGHGRKQYDGLLHGELLPGWPAQPNQSHSEKPGWPEFNRLPVISEMIYEGLRGKPQEDIADEIQYARRWRENRAHDFREGLREGDDWRDGVILDHPAAFKQPKPPIQTAPMYLPKVPVPPPPTQTFGIATPGSSQWESSADVAYQEQLNAARTVRVYEPDRVYRQELATSRAFSHPMVL